MCVACRERKEKKELIKIIRTPDGFSVAKSNEAGRGAYVCFDEKCLAKGMKRLSRSLSAEISAETAAEIAERIKNG